MNAIDPDNLLQFRERLNVAGEFLCGLTDNPKAARAYAAVLYVQSSLKLDAEEMRLAAQQEQNPWAHIPKQYEGRWTFDYDQKRGMFFVCCNGHSILDSEDSEVCDAVCKAHNVWIKQTEDAALICRRTPMDVNSEEAAEWSNLMRRNSALEAAAGKVVHEYLSPGSVGSRVEAAIYELRDVISKNVAGQ